MRHQVVTVEMPHLLSIKGINYKKCHKKVEKYSERRFVYHMVSKHSYIVNKFLATCKITCHIESHQRLNIIVYRCIHVYPFEIQKY